MRIPLLQEIESRDYWDKVDAAIDQQKLQEFRRDYEFSNAQPVNPITDQRKFEPSTSGKNEDRATQARSSHTKKFKNNVGDSNGRRA